MAFEDIQAEISLLLTQMQNEPKDRHELYEQIHAKLQELKAFGLALPQDLVDLEHSLEEEFEADRRESGTRPSGNDETA